LLSEDDKYNENEKKEKIDNYISELRSKIKKIVLQINLK
jgi:hypothetical protein